MDRTTFDVILAFVCGGFLGWMWCELKHCGMIAAAWSFVVNPDARKVYKEDDSQ
jgi:hypothetical protein